MDREILDSLLDIKTSIEKENVSYGEIGYLQNHQKEILELGDVVLAEWAGIPEEVFMEKVYGNKQKNKRKNNKPIICLETGKIFYYSSELCDELRCTRQNLNAHLHGKTKSCCGMHFKYYDGKIEEGEDDGED